MPDRTIKLRELRRILRRFDVEEAPFRGKGSHILFQKRFPEGTFTYPVPNKKDVNAPYVRECRKKFRLTPEDGVSDEAFYGK
jgi:hypothetical protein